ncbi:hypothetical protein PVK06_031888 [Gossypium arboreum]|uniref:Uncharacterized protein n=1 Tax=Gossypium arboreum TaxID=29729 RepID=A0ABR0NS91_GOSAR|nr:hypothetical protein PVK06_031888 [Gossypium arboreum]
MIYPQIIFRSVWQSILEISLENSLSMMRSHGDSFFLIRLNQSMKELEYGRDLLLKAQSKRATVITNIWIREGGDAGVIGANLGKQAEEQNLWTENIQGREEVHEEEVSFWGWWILEESCEQKVRSIWEASRGNVLERLAILCNGLSD